MNSRKQKKGNVQDNQKKRKPTNKTKQNKKQANKKTKKQKNKTPPRQKNEIKQNKNKTNCWLLKEKETREKLGRIHTEPLGTRNRHQQEVLRYIEKRKGKKGGNFQDNSKEKPPTA